MPRSRVFTRNAKLTRRVRSLSPRPSPPALASRGGFALLITITLLAFIVILLLGLAVYTRVETSIAGNTQRQAQARQNALFALNVALAQLQKHAGPDTRVTATAANFNPVDGTRHYTGVWSSDPAKTDALTWLVSGNEIALPDVPDPNPDAPEGSTVPAPLAVTPANPGSRLQTLVGAKSTGAATRDASWVDAPLVDLTATGVPGIAAAAPAATIGRYAWWVGDQGVKAPVAMTDTTGTVSFAPFTSDDLRARLRQQLPLGAGPVDVTSGDPWFEPRDTNNASLLANGRITATNQLAFVRTGGSTQLGLARVQQNFHAWSPNNFAVLANTKLGGLRQDLSLSPTLLGNAFAAWANYSAYMEKFVPDAPVVPPADGEGTTTTTEPTAPAAPSIVPAYGDDPLRRRYVMTPHLFAGNGSHQVGPVLNYFLLTFNVRTENSSTATRPLEVRARWMLSFWNPYTSALVPENLRVEVTGLPTRVNVINETPERAGLAESFSLRDAYGSPLRINLPWDAANVPADTPAEDRQSWLPGRVYTWRSIEDTTKPSDPPEGGYASQFYSQTLNDAGDGVLRPIPGAAVDGDDSCHLEVSGADQLVVTLYAVRPEGDVRLGRFTSPAFVDSFITSPQLISGRDYQFSYVFRFAESIDSPDAPGTWLTTTERDPRRRTLPAECYVVGENGNDPAQYGASYSRIRNPDRLLDRATNGWSYNEDVPVFELPRAPLLSLGALQHFRMVGQRPFMIGNSWGVNFQLNSIPLGALFDRFFFSGVTEGVVPTAAANGDLIVPNVLLKPLRKADGTKVTLEDLRPTPVTPPETSEPVEPPTEPPPTEETPVEPTPVDPTIAERIAASRTAKHFLQSGAFNLNSTNPAAWAAVLRNVRFIAPQSFTYLDASAETGTAADTTIASLPSSNDAHFFRFSQSAQETFKAEPGMASNDAETASPAHTEFFRRGVRTLTGAEVAALAAKITALVGVKHAAETGGGPFRSLEEFLSPSVLFGIASSEEGGEVAPRALLEAAIAEAGINASITEFSSQFLTQGDIMTALAPILFPRSDTFVIRTYGEAVNPVKLPLTYKSGDAIPNDAIEGRAWAEAIVQRVPEYFADPANNPPEKLPSEFDVAVNPDDPASGPTATDRLNQTYGRRFKVISFRWLTRLDI